MNIFSRANQWIPWEFFFQVWDSSLNKYISYFKTCLVLLNKCTMFEFYACSCLASFKSNRKNKNQQTERRRRVKTISWKQIPSVILRVNGHLDYYWSESKIAERATITKVTGIMQFYECQPDYIRFV